MRQLKNPLFVFSVFLAAFLLWFGCKTARPATVKPPDNFTAALHPGPNDPRIAYVTTRLMEEFHYLQRPLDEELSKKFFDEYVGGSSGLDPRHEHFLQSDLAEFDIYRTNLDSLMNSRHGAADLTPAFAIYERFAERAAQHTAYADELLRHAKFKFTADDTIMIDRRHEPFPKNLDEAKALWRQQLRYEYLQEKLSREISETNGTFNVKLPANATSNIVATLERHYRWNLHMLTNWDSDNILQVYLNALTHAYDPHSDYLNAPHAQDFSMQMNLSLFGIGAKLQEDDGYCTIKELVPGGPAAKSKVLKEEDRIVAVAQANQPAVDVVDMELEKVVQMIRGSKNTKVSLTISPAADRTARHTITLVRDEIKLEDSEAKARLIEMPGGLKLGVIDLPSFYAPVDSHVTPRYCSVDMATLVKKLKKEHVSGIIIDMRTNPGGSLDEAVKLTGLFIKSGPIVLARNPDGQVMVDTDPDPSQLFDGPLLVMVNRFSASAAEIAAAALQDYGRALIVGDISTFGKGTVQNLNLLRQLPFVWPQPLTPTNDPGTLKITIRKFYRVSGGSTQFKGVVPDIILPDVLNFSEFAGEKSLDNPLPWDTIQPVAYDKLNLVQPYVATLRADSDARISTNQDYAYIKQDIAQFQKFQSEKTAPLNERVSIEERERIAKQNKSRDDEREQRPASDVKIYEISLADCAKPGLPAPDTYFTTNDVADAASVSDKDKNALVESVKTNAAMIGSEITNRLNIAVHAHSSPSQPDKVVSKFFQPDPMLDESERILTDYISLLSKKDQLIAHH